jgi:hypothetical protein
MGSVNLLNAARTKCSYSSAKSAFGPPVPGSAPSTCRPYQAATAQGSESISTLTALRLRLVQD